MKTNTMKSYRSLIAGNLFLSLFLLLPAPARAAENWVTYGASPTGSRVKIEGTSTLHAWTMEGQLIGGKLELEQGVQLDPSLKPGKVNARAQVSIPVRSLKSGKDTMDQVYQQAMKQDKFKNIEYRLTELVLKEAPKAEGLLQFDSTGELIVAGVTNKISMPVTILRVSPTRLKVSGATDIKMTAYGVTPPAPKLALGAIKTGNEIKIVFDWVVSQRSETAKASEKTQ